MTTAKEHALQIRLTGLGFSILVLMFASLGSVSLNVSESIRIGGVLLLTALVYGIFEYAARVSQKDNQTKRTTLRILTGLIVTAIIICVYSAAKSLGEYPFDSSGIKFFYENTATAAGITAWILTVLLSTLQKDIYWISRKNTVQFDERLIKQRQEIFETSYKIGTFLTVGTIIIISLIMPDMINIATMTNSQNVPGVFYWILISLVNALFVLPLVIAAWKTK